MRWWLLLFLAGCGSAVPDLPKDVSAPALPGDAAQGRAAIYDRSAARTGMACADCHQADARPRPAPSLARIGRQSEGWWGGVATLEAAIQRCTERTQRRPGPSGRQLGDLVAALRSWPEVAVDSYSTDPAALYGVACAHCHEAGLGGPLRGRGWPRAFLKAAIQGPRESPLDALMPTFSPAQLPGMEALVAWLAPAGAPSSLWQGAPGDARVEHP